MVRTKKLRKTDYHDLAELERSPLLADLRCNRDPRNCLDAHRQERQQIRLSRRRDDRPGRTETKTMTTMAFGKSYAEVGKLLRKGRAVDLAVQFDGGTVKVLGRPRDKVAEAEYTHPTAKAATPTDNP